MSTNVNITEAVSDDAWIPSVCYMCYFGSCGIKVHRVNGVVVKIEGDPENPYNCGRLCAKGNAGMMSLYNPYRVQTPLKRTNPEKGLGVDPRWVEISWEEALNLVVEKLRKVREENPRKLVILSFDLACFATSVAPAFASAFGTPYFFPGAANFFCGNALHPATYLTQGAFFSDPDTEYCNYLILMGAQTGFLANSNPTPTAGKTADARIRGMRVVVVDPVGSNAAAKADEWVPIRPGTDGALALTMLNVLLNELGLYDAEFLKNYTNGPYLIGPEGYYLRDEVTAKPLIWDLREGVAKPYDAGDIQDPALLGTYSVHGVEVKTAFQLLKDHVQRYTPEAVSEITTVSVETIRRLAREFGEAARIGSKIVIQGKELPYRPACVDWKRGVNAHRHAMLTGMAIQLLNVVVGAIDVPGGFLGCDTVGPNWRPQEGPDGLIIPGRAAVTLSPYPARPVKEPKSIDLLELFPVASYSTPMAILSLREPEKYKLSYQPEVLIHCRSNLMMSSVNPEIVATVLKKIPFMVSFTREIDETVEFADVVLPDTHYLERLDVFAKHFAHIQPGLAQWYFAIRQPVVKPPEGVRTWLEVLLEIADRLGILPDVNVMLNTLLDLKEPYKLEPGQKYTWEEFADRRAKSLLGPEHGVDWFKEHGFIQWPKRVEEAYSRPFLRARIPIYFEFLKRAGEEVRRVTEGIGLLWDVSDYQPLPDWRPCPGYGDKATDYDLYVVSYKLPFHSFSYTMTNPWLNELARHNPYAYNVVIHAQVAQRKGIRDGDLVEIESEEGYKVKGRVKVSECIHPEVVGIAGTAGHWAQGEPIARGQGVHWNTLVPVELERIDTVTAAVDSCIRVKVKRAE